MKFSAIIICLLLAVSCNQNTADRQSASEKDSIKITDTVIVTTPAPVPAIIADSLPSGVYQGVFPCKDCEGIQQTILFSGNKTYREEQMIWSGNHLPKVSRGSWSLKNGKIVLTQNNRPAIDFIKKGDTIVAVNIDGIPISNSSKYTLIKRALAGNNPVWEKKQQQGIDFSAVGHDPFWNLDIYYGKTISFKLAEWNKPVIAQFVKPVVNPDSTIYKIKGDTLQWRIIVFPLFCSDGVSSNLYPYKVHVQYKGVWYKGCGLQLSTKNSL
ncbi:MAG TPA: copper resistance protein NlpE N-terminal domain-containing protein [Chitinophagaceae bacterium]|nr:copper resistance protein NlpE N-terminal domain-containing protein [Chitinophagaceae bacterium]